jgi:AcrR family transcriptional regulator
MRVRNVSTPWGDSPTLRQRRLRPGPGTPAAEVAENQRRRLFGAMVASVAENGYGATRVSDLSRLSGVSSRSFYDLFPDKRSCFLAALDVLLERATEAVAVADQSWRARVRAQFDALAAATVAQPAAARMCLFEVFAAGPQATAALDRALAKIEAQAALAFGGGAGRTPASDQVVAALVGSVVELVRARLLRGEAAELGTLGNELVPLLAGYEPPTKALRLSGRPPAVKAEAPEARDHAERGLRAFEALLSEQGYAETTMEQVARRASMSAKTLYANFAGKEEVLLAALDSAGAQIVAAVMPAFRRNGDWGEGVRAGLGALFSLLASRPEMARLVLDELFAGGAPAWERRADTLRPLQALFAGGRHYSEVAAIAPQALLGGVLALARKALRESGPEALPGLVPAAAFFALEPFLGAEEATAIAAGEAYGRRRSQRDEMVRELAGQATSELLLSALFDRPRTPSEVTAEIELPQAEVRAGLERLFRAGIVQQIGERGTGAEPVYAPSGQLIETETWESYSPQERLQVSDEVRQLISTDVELAVEAGSFDSRPDRHLSRVPLWVDERGWREVGETIEAALQRCLEIRAESKERLRAGGGEMITGRAVLMTFELPEEA